MAVIEQELTDKYALYCGDSCEVLPDLPTGIAGLILYSPPFNDLYNYSSSERDLSNCRDYEQFMEHYGFIVRELSRLTQPGRINCVHCCDIPIPGQRTGYRDFPGDIIKLHEKHGYYYKGRICIWKEPFRVAMRTRLQHLTHKNVCKDSSVSFPAGGDFVLLFKRHGENKEPIAHPIGLSVYAGEQEVPTDLLRYRGERRQEKNRLSQWIWRQYASCFWHDIRLDRVLPYKASKEPDDERHVCLAAGSLVLTKSGYLPIESVSVGDAVLTHMGRWKPVVAKRMNSVKEVVQVKAQGVPFLRLTPDHLLWCRIGLGLGGGRGNRWKPGSPFHPRANAAKRSPEWMRADQTKSHYLNLPLPPIEYSPLSESDWWVIGRWLGDGHMDARGYPHISCSVKEASSLAVALGKRAGFSRQVNRGTVAIAVKDSAPVSGVAGGRRTTVFTEVLRKCGRGAARKQIPPEAFALEPVKAEALLSGYLSADGHFVSRYQRWSASSVSRGLMLGMAILAQRARGVAASVYAGRPPGECVIEGRRCETLQDWILGIPPRNMSGMILDDGAWKKVREVKPSGCDEVWDLQVEDDESFVAEGCVVHNCPLQLDVIERCLLMWSNPGDKILTPFMGVGSEVYGAIVNGRRAVGIELKHSYFKQAKKNIKAALAGDGQADMWGIIGSEAETEESEVEEPA